MRLSPLYRVRFRYPEGWEVALGAAGEERQSFFFADGRCEGRVSGRFRGANHPRRRSDGTYQPDFQGVILTDDGATVFFDMRGYGRSYPVGRRQIVVSCTHLSDDDRYAWLNETLAVGTGEVRAGDGGRGPELVIDMAELLWESLSE
jgi:hypothetical protein